jgi:hypothetical protein
MKLNLLFESRDSLVLIAWARETSLGIYMGVRFSPSVENFSYFSDGQRQLLRFPMTPNRTRRREEAPLDPRPSIAAIEKCELVLERVVDLVSEPVENSPAPEASAETVNITISREDIGDATCLRYDAHIVRDPHWEAFKKAEQNRPDRTALGGIPLQRVFPLNHFPGHSLALQVWREQAGLRLG